MSQACILTESFPSPFLHGNSTLGRTFGMFTTPRPGQRSHFHHKDFTESLTSSLCMSYQNILIESPHTSLGPSCLPGARRDAVLRAWGFAFCVAVLPPVASSPSVGAHG